MPKVSTSSHPLAGLRAICGFSREEIARIAGITAASVQNIELGRALMSEGAARRIEAATGCRASSLMDKKSALLRIDGEPYTRQSYIKFQNASAAESEDVESAAADLQFRLRTLLSASGNKFLYVARRLADALDDVLLETGISMDTLESVERRGAALLVGEMDLAELQQKVGAHPVFMNWLKLNPQPAKSVCKVAIEVYQHWPTMEFENHAAFAQKIIRSRHRIEFADGQRLEIITEDFNIKGIFGNKTPIPEEGTIMPTSVSPAFKPRKAPARKGSK